VPRKGTAFGKDPLSAPVVGVVELSELAIGKLLLSGPAPGRAALLVVTEGIGGGPAGLSVHDKDPRSEPTPTSAADRGAQRMGLGREEGDRPLYKCIVGAQEVFLAIVFGENTRKRAGGPSR
jgi:hypothetical protein